MPLPDLLSPAAPTGDEKFQALSRAAAPQDWNRVFQNTDLGIGTADVRGALATVNPALCAMLGYSQEELAGKTIAGLMHPEDQELTRDLIDKVLRGTIRSCKIDERCLTKNGSVIWGRVSVSVVHSERSAHLVLAIEDISSAKRDEERLQQVERRLRWLLDSSPVGVVETNRHGRVLAANDAFYRLIGWDRDAFARAGMDLFQITPPEWIELTDANLRSISAGERSVLYEKEYWRRDKSRVPVMIARSFGEGSPDEVLTFVIDLTEQKKAEERFRLVVEAAPNAMIMAGDDGRITLVNSQTEKLFGYERAELLAQPVKMLVPERFRERHAGHRGSFFAAPSARAMGSGMELFGRRKDGSEVPIEIGLNPIDTLEGHFVLASIIDITERKKAEERKVAESTLRESERELRLLANAMPPIVWSARPDGCRSYYNQRWYDFSGFPPGAAGDEGWRAICHPDDLRSSLEVWRAAVESGTAYETQYRLLDRRTGSYRWHLDRALPIRDEQGAISKWIGTCTDINDRKEAEMVLEESVRERTRQLEAALSEKTVLLKEVHHRVKNNLTVIASLLERHAEATNDPRVIASLHDSQRRVHCMALVHEHLYATDKLDRVDFANYIHQLADELYESLVPVSGSVHLSVEAESREIGVHQAIPCGLILNELLSNAFKYGFPEGRSGEVQVQFHAIGGGYLSLVVHDNGVGIADGFEWRKAKSLGLQIVQILTKQLGGTIEMRRESGARFELVFPG